MIKVKIKKEIAEFIENSGESCATGDREFIHYPFWLLKTDNPEVFEVYEGKDLPNWIKEELDIYGKLKESLENE